MVVTFMKEKYALYREKIYIVPVTHPLESSKPHLSFM